MVALTGNYPKSALEEAQAPATGFGAKFGAFRARGGGGAVTIQRHGTGQSLGGKVLTAVVRSDGKIWHYWMRPEDAHKAVSAGKAKFVTHARVPQPVGAHAGHSGAYQRSLIHRSPLGHQIPNSNLAFRKRVVKPFPGFQPLTPGDG